VSIETEWRLIRECRRGRTASFGPLVAGYQAEGLAIAESLLLDRDDAADAVQEAFVRAYSGLGRLADGSAFGPWFRTIVRNLCLDQLRSASRRLREPLTGDVEGEAFVEPIGTTRLERADVAASIREALGAISVAHREVLVLKEIEGLSYEEIARALGIPPGTVASRVFHARAALRRVLLNAGVNAGDVAT
jgi:RNA polymerase sigma-70 factor (ECF subfamily)